MTSIDFSYKERMWVIGAIVLGLGFPVLLLLFQSTEHIEEAQSLCPFMLLTGLPCPGCGMTKSVMFLLLGDIHKSISYHLFGLPVFTGSLALIGLSVTEMITRKSYFRDFLYSARNAYVLAVLLGVYHFTRLIWLLYHSNADDILRASIWK
jgi:hypothetical protein